MSGRDSAATSAEPRSTNNTAEPLACVACRSRKLKCDKVRPVCSRCVKAEANCVYPESRRKPAVRRRNVQELEARLAQVEALLHETGSTNSRREEPIDYEFDANEPLTEDVFLQGLDYTLPEDLDGSSDPAMWSHGHDGGVPSDQHQQPMTDLPWELMDLGGLAEGLPPIDMMEDLNRIFFERQQQFVPIIHPARYLQAFYSAPHMRPPMALQYAIWALASNGHRKYKSYHEVFYQRARKYIDADEMKGYGEHFITVSHAQTWCLIATDEAKSMMFTRAAMSCARAVRLAQMMGLHQLDCPPEEMAPTLVPPRDWAELEERRRVFWGIFCVDSHCSVSTGWPHLIDSSEVTTHLPTSEVAFQTGNEEVTSSIHDAFKGVKYSSFASAIIVSHLFSRIFRHVHHRKPNDNPDNYEYGGYWERHRDIDNDISSAFMFLPEAFRMPNNYRDATAVHTNLNLHASVIILHHAAIDRIELYEFPNHIKKLSLDRIAASAQEIVNIVKITSHVSSNPRSPLAAMSLYVAASVFIMLSKENGGATPEHVANLDFITTAMEAIGRNHVITRAFLRQILLDIEHNDVRYLGQVPRLDRVAAEGVTGAKGKRPDAPDTVSHNIPLLARSDISRHTDVQPPLPGRLPLGKPVGTVIRNHDGQGEEAAPANFPTEWAFSQNNGTHHTPPADADSANSNKRKRGSPSADISAAAAGDSEPLWAAGAPSPTTNLPHRAGTSPQTSGNPTPPPPPQGTGSSSSSSKTRHDSRQGVSINSTMFRNFGPRPYATCGREQAAARNQQEATIGSGGGGGSLRNQPFDGHGLSKWDMASLCMYTQFLHGKGDFVEESTHVANPWTTVDSAVAAEVDWSLLPTMTTDGGTGPGHPEHGAGWGGGAEPGGGAGDGAGQR